MKRVYKERISRFTSLVSVIMLTMMLAVFCMFIPDFFVSFYGRVFAFIWAAIAIAAFIAHTRQLSQGKNRLQGSSCFQDNKAIGKMKRNRHHRMLDSI